MFFFFRRTFLLLFTLPSTLKSQNIFIYTSTFYSNLNITYSIDHIICINIYKYLDYNIQFVQLISLISI